MTKLFIIGDIHNAWGTFQAEILEKDIHDADIIHVGDGGYGFFARRPMNEHLQKQNFFLEERNIVLYNVRGNHDNPNWFLSKANMLKFFREEDKEVPTWKKEDMHYLWEYMTPTDYVEAITNYSNIKFVQDYSILELAGHRILCIGGAISIDRKIRKTGRDYFTNEPVVYNPSKLKKISGVDIVVTHTMPDFIPPYDQKSDIIDFYRLLDTQLIPDLQKERKVMTKIYKDIAANNRPKLWYFGHFHSWNNTYYEKTQFLCLPANKTYEVS